MDSKLPTFKKGENLQSFLDKMHKYEIYVNEDKYDFILKFVNRLLKLKGNTKYQKLGDMKWVKGEDILKYPKHNRKVLEKYADDIKKKFDFTPNTAYENNKYIIKCLEKMLDSIGYKLKRSKRKKDSFYTIAKIVAHTHYNPKVSTLSYNKHPELYR